MCKESRHVLHSEIPTSLERGRQGVGGLWRRLLQKQVVVSPVTSSSSNPGRRPQRPPPPTLSLSLGLTGQVKLSQLCTSQCFGSNNSLRLGCVQRLRLQLGYYAQKRPPPALTGRPMTLPQASSAAMYSAIQAAKAARAEASTCLAVHFKFRTRPCDSRIPPVRPKSPTADHGKSHSKTVDLPKARRREVSISTAHSGVIATGSPSRPAIYHKTSQTSSSAGATIANPPARTCEPIQPQHAIPEPTCQQNCGQGCPAKRVPHKNPHHLLTQSSRGHPWPAPAKYAVSAREAKLWDTMSGRRSGSSQSRSPPAGLPCERGTARCPLKTCFAHTSTNCPRHTSSGCPAAFKGPKSPGQGIQMLQINLVEVEENRTPGALGRTVPAEEAALEKT